MKDCRYVFWKWFSCQNTKALIPVKRSLFDFYFPILIKNFESNKKKSDFYINIDLDM